MTTKARWREVLATLEKRAMDKCLGRTYKHEDFDAICGLTDLLSALFLNV